MNSRHSFCLVAALLIGASLTGCQKAPASSGETKMSDQDKQHFGGSKDVTPQEAADHFRQMREAYMAKHPNFNPGTQGGPPPGAQAGPGAGSTK